MYGYLPEHRPSADEWSWAIETFQTLAETPEAHQVNLSIEPVIARRRSFSEREEAKRFCQIIHHLRIEVTIDTFHANIEERNIASAITSVGPYLKHLHLSENDRGPLDRGHVYFPAVIGALEQIGYQGYLMFEGFGYSPTEKNSPGALWADLSDSALGHLHMLARTFRQMLVILEKNVSDQRAIWQALWQGFRIPPFAADDLIQQARCYKSRCELTRALRLIARADLELRTSPPDMRLVLERLIYDLASEPRPEPKLLSRQLSFEG